MCYVTNIDCSSKVCIEPGINVLGSLMKIAPALACIEFCLVPAKLCFANIISGPSMCQILLCKYVMSNCYE